MKLISTDLKLVRINKATKRIVVVMNDMKKKKKKNGGSENRNDKNRITSNATDDKGNPRQEIYVSKSVELMSRCD